MEFSTKQKSLFKTDNPQQNKFVREALKVSSETTSGNGALKYTTSNDVFVDNFALIANFKNPRSYADVTKDMETLWSVSPQKCLKLAVYIRMITRESKVVVKKEVITLDVQRGQGLKNEGIMRMLWLAINHKQVFTKNMPYFIAAGSWKDVFEMMSLDLQYHGWEGRKLDWNFLRSVIYAGLANPETSELVKKYLPTIHRDKDCKTIESQAKTIIGRYLAKCLFGGESVDSSKAQRLYRKLKASGTAHQWQQAISKHKMLEINFDSIHGRALSLLVGSKFLENQGLVEKYQKWIMSKPVAKFTGYVHELFAPLGLSYFTESLPEYKINTINKQFEGLVELGKKNLNNNTKLLVVRDISGSMTSKATGTNMSSYAIGKAMALYFSSLFEGPFKNIYATFSHTCSIKEWKGTTAVDKWRNDTESVFGSTEVLSVARLFVRLKSSMGVSESEFPTGALLISDGEFNYAGHNVTNFEIFRQILVEGGFSKEYARNFKLILWDLPNGYYGNGIRPKFEDFADAPNNFYISGYDPSSVAFILGVDKKKETPKNATELFNAAMDQDLLNMLDSHEYKSPKKKSGKNKSKKN